MTSNKEKELRPYIPAIIEHLEHVRKRKAVFLGEVRELAVFNYLSGLHRAFSIVGYDLDERLYWQVCAERGWKENTLGPQKRMRDAGWTEEAIVEELLAIEIETWRRIARRN